MDNTLERARDIAIRFGQLTWGDLIDLSPREERAVMAALRMSAIMPGGKDRVRRVKCLCGKLFAKLVVIHDVKPGSLNRLHNVVQSHAVLRKLVFFPKLFALFFRLDEIADLFGAVVICGSPCFINKKLPQFINLFFFRPVYVSRMEIP